LASRKRKWRKLSPKPNNASDEAGVARFVRLAFRKAVYRDGAAAMDQRDAELLDRWLVPRFRRDATTGLSDFNDSQRRNDDGGSYRKIRRAK
jgi:hypothetical protein